MRDKTFSSKPGVPGPRDITHHRTEQQLLMIDRERAQEITLALGNDEWDAAESAAFEEHTFELAGQMRRSFPGFFAGNSEDRDAIKAIVDRLEQHATIFEQFVKKVGRFENTLGLDLHAAAAHLSEKADHREGLHRAARLLLSEEPFPIVEALDTLARYKRIQAEALKKLLHKRGDQAAADFVVRATWGLLTHYGIDPIGYKDADTYRTTGALVTACAMLRGDDPTRAYWAARAAEKIRKELGISKPRKAKAKMRTKGKAKAKPETMPNAKAKAGAATTKGTRAPTKRP